MPGPVAAPFLLLTHSPQPRIPSKESAAEQKAVDKEKAKNRASLHAKAETRSDYDKPYPPARPQALFSPQVLFSPQHEPPQAKASLEAGENEPKKLS